jgi:hypothetical protein
MTQSNLLRLTVETIQSQVTPEILKALLFEAIQSLELDEYIARLTYFTSPSYLPFATYDGGMMAFHLWPGRDISQSPILYVPTDQPQALFVCDCLANLPTAIWLWVGRYFKDDLERLRQNIQALVENIPGARPVPDALWSLLEHNPGWWSPNCSNYTNQAWATAGVGHPFAGKPEISWDAEPQEVLPQLESFVSSRANIPELVAVLLATRIRVGLQSSVEDVLKILSAEAWRNLDCIYTGSWRLEGGGLCEWDATLQGLENSGLLLDSPFEVLINHKDVYSSNNRDGYELLISVAEAFRSLGDREGELRQLRNAATVSLITSGEYPIDLALRIAEVCDDISPNSLASAVARESSRVHEQGP